ncbi:lipopolysaccharide biosynthesis protein [Rhodococcus sp. AB351]|uniref:lipopolysaccharide biosynthesis protein n=1 Tax=Rhodococcus sp. AB351 TaxID=3413280 RepID=UPI003C23BDE6
MSAPGNGLASIAARGAAVTVLGQLAKFAIQFGGIILLARLLFPEDFGLVAMVAAILGIAEVLRDFGLSAAAIQAKNLTDGQRTNLFWINTSIGFALSVLAYLCAPLIASLYGDPRLVSVAQALSVTFLVNGAITQFRANLSRQMKFGRLAIVDIAAQGMGLLSAIFFAIEGAGYWSLVAQQIVQSVVTLVSAAALGRWLPALPRRNEEMRGLLSFGWNLMGTQLLQYASKNIDSVIVGHQFGATWLGFYNRAAQVVNGPLNQINVPATTVALPILSRLQDDADRYDRFIVRGQTALMTLVVGGFLFAAAESSAVIEVLLGPTWTDAAEIFMWIAIGAAFQGAGYATYWVFLSKGITGSMLRYSIVARTLSISLLVVGAFFGVEGVAVAYAMGIALSWPLGMVWIKRASDAPVGKLFRNGLRTLLVYSFAAATARFTAQWMDIGSFGELAVGAAAMIAVCLLVASVYAPYRRDLLAIGELGKLLAKRGSSSAK